MSVCIQYSRPGATPQDSEVFGFDVAVTNFIKAYFRYSKERPFICRPNDITSFDHFKELATSEGIDSEKNCIGLDPRHPEKNLQSISCLFRPDPLTADLIWRRQQMREHGFATCGLVHTMSGERIVNAVGNLCFAPSDPSDALICPSKAIQRAIRNLWELQSEYINHRFGGHFSCPVQTPIIPLGVDTEKIAKQTSAEKRAQQRKVLGVSDDEVVILFVGRLSFATKAHPLPMFMAAEKAAIQTKRKVRLVLYGYFKPKDMEGYFKDLAADLCKKVAVEFIMNDDPRFPDGVWAAADIFTSLSDNIQESFGFTPIEAMASGLPAVITDWDGYRDGVRNGSEGFLVPTLTPPPSSGMALAQLYYNEENYGISLSGAAQSTSVDIEWCSHSYAVLIDNADLRHQFGQSGIERARTIFDWRHIIHAYDDLWKSLSEERTSRSVQESLPQNWQAMHLNFPNPWQMFKDFPTKHLLPEDVIHIVMDKDQTDMIMRHVINFFVTDLLLPQAQLLQLISVIRQAKAIRIENILSAVLIEEHDRLWRSIGWLLKHGVCMVDRRKYE